jgi:hypothetical protein
MSQTDSFIDEVTDEVRRDRLFATMRRWAPLAVLLVLLVVGGAAVREWRAAGAEAEAEARGAALLAALEAEDAAAALAVEAEGEAAALAALLSAAIDPEAATDRLAALAADSELAPRYRDLAVLAADVSDVPLEERRARLEAIAGPGAPYRLLAEERLALLSVEAGETEAALAALRAILDDAETTPALRERARQLVVALGGDLDAA